MPNPTKQDALDAAEVFFTALNVLLYHGEFGEIKDHALAQAAASLRASMICTSMAEEMGVDSKSLERVGMHIVQKRMAEQKGNGSDQLVNRFLDYLKDDHATRN